ncbi:MAG: NAD(P)H-dependent glycerol-3-phosphate dehydrogenase [Planctomycetota bacterium]
MRVLVLGAGSFGTSLACVLASNGIAVDLWCRSDERAADVARGRHSLLSDLTLPAEIAPVRTGALGSNYGFAISAVPTQHLAAVLDAQQSQLPTSIPWVSASKGIEIGTSRLPSGILRDAGIGDVAVLSGPSHAEEVVRGVPTAVVLGHGGSAKEGQWLQENLSGESFRVYLNSDVVGVELGGALKNVIALGAGIAIGIGFGDNTVAALVTRGAVELARLGEALGGKSRTFSGLSGIGDLVVTCCSEHSRNRSLGVRIGAGEEPRQALSGLPHVVEGVYTSKAVVDLGQRVAVEMPIAEEVYKILHEGKPVDQGIRELLGRSLKEE